MVAGDPEFQSCHHDNRRALNLNSVAHIALLHVGGRWRERRETAWRTPSHLITSVGGLLQIQAEAADCIKGKGDLTASCVSSKFICYACLAARCFRGDLAVKSRHFLDSFASRDTVSPGWLRAVFVRCL